MGVTLAIFSLSGKIPCDKDSSKGVLVEWLIHRNNVELPWHLCYRTFMLCYVPGILLDLRDKKASFSPFIDTVCSKLLI